MESINNYIGGEFVAPSSGAYLDNWNPAIGEVYSRVSDSDERDVQLAVAAAVRAFPAWSALPAVERARILRRIGALIRERQEELARIESVDTGKPVSAALVAGHSQERAELRILRRRDHAVFERVPHH